MKWTLILLNKSYKKLYQQVWTLYPCQTIHRYSYTKKKKERWTIVGLRLVVADRWVLIQVHPAAVFPKSPSLHLIGKRKWKQNLSTAASRFGLRSATEPGAAPRFWKWGGGQFCERSASKKIFLNPHFLASGGCRVLSLSDRRYSLNPLSQTRIDWVGRYRIRLTFKLSCVWH